MLMRIVYKIKSETLKEYIDWSKGSIEYWRKKPGFKEMRAWREPGTGRVLLDIEFENFEMWGKAYDDPKIKELNSQFASYTYDGEYDLWDISPVIPKPLKPL
jgi:hypothetical protein